MSIERRIKPRPTPMANPPKFLPLESETMTNPTLQSNRNQSLTGKIKLKMTVFGLIVAKKEKNAEMHGSAPTLGIGTMS